VVLTVTVEVALPVIEAGLSEQVGAGVPVPVTAHARFTAALKPFVALTLITEVADPPGVAIVADVGVAVSVKPGAVLAVTVKLTVAVWFVKPDAVPVIVTVEVAAGVLAAVEIVRVTGPAVTGLVGVNAQAAPAGRPEQARATVPLNPPWSATVREYDALPPAVTVALVGALAVRVKPGPTAAPDLKETACVTQFPPVIIVVASQLPTAEVI